MVKVTNEYSYVKTGICQVFSANSFGRFDRHKLHPLSSLGDFFCFVPLWIFILKANSTKEVFCGAWITQFLLTLIGFNWIVYTAHEFGGFNYFISFLTLLVFAAIANLYIPVASLASHFVFKKFETSTFNKVLLLGFVTAICEVFSVTIFKWNFAYTWYWIGSDVVQTAEVFGFQGLSSLIILLNIPAFIIATSPKEKWRYISAGIIIAFFTVFTFWGQALKNSLPKTDAEVNTLIVQANISNAQKIAAEAGNNADMFIVNEFLGLTEQGLDEFPQTDFVLWPETAFPDFMNDRFFYQITSRKVREFFTSNQKHLITGGYTYHPRTQTERYRVSNSLFFLEPGRDEPFARYDKHILLIFGEYVPGMQTFPWIKKLLPYVGNFKPGLGPEVVDFKGVKVGAQICYESLYPEFSIGLAKKGAQVITNVTNDSWYGPYQEPYQHLYMTLARSIENRVPMIRSTNTGISTVSLANGKVLEQSPVGEKWFGLFTVPYHTQPKVTFYQNNPNLITYLLFAGLLAMLALILWKGRSTR